MGGSFVWGVARPTDTVQFSDLKHVPSYTATNRMDSTLPSSAWTFLHNGAVPYTISGRFYLKSVVHGARILSTYNQGATSFGVRVLVNAGFLAWYITNGTTQSLVNSTVPLVANTWYTFVIIHTGGGNYTIQVDTETPVALTHPTITTAASHTLRLGSDSTGANALNGFLAELVIHDIVLNASQLATLRAYYASRWSSVPGIVAYLDADNGLTIASGLVSAWADRAVGNNLADNGAATRPALVSPWRNGQNALQFDGTDDSMFRTALLHGNLAQPSAVYHVGECANPLVGTRRLTSYMGSTTVRNDEYVQVAAEAFGMYAGVTRITLISPTSAGLAFASFAHYNGASSANGMYTSDGSFHTSTGDAGAQPRAGLVVGSFQNVTSFWNGKIALTMLVDHVPSAAGHTEIINANRARYNI